MSFAKLVHNSTYAMVHAEPLLDRQGADVLSVVAKLALAFDRAGRLGLSARRVRQHDDPDDAGGLRYPSDLAVEKPGTDVALVGTLVPPEPPGASVIAWLRVGPLAKAVEVFGPRVYMPGLGGGPKPGPATPLDRTPLLSALAYGGVVRDADDAPVSFEAHNPSGRGHPEGSAKLAGTPAPQIEPTSIPGAGTAPNPRSLIARAQAPFAPIPPQWEPRLSRLGTRDARWRRMRAPVVPEDFDAQAESWASSGLWSEAPLSGNEPIEIGGLRPGPPIRLRLPGFAPSFQSVESGLVRLHATHLDGVLVDLDEGVVELTWRAAIPLPLKWARLERVEVRPSTPLAPEIVERPLMRGETG